MIDRLDESIVLDRFVVETIVLMLLLLMLLLMLLLILLEDCVVKVKVSFCVSLYHGWVNGMGVVKQLERDV